MSVTARKWAPWVAMALVLLVALGVGARPGEDRTDADRARDLAASVKCPTCRSQSVADSDASTARAIEGLIERRIRDGQSDEQIRDYLVGRYGEEVLLTPSSSGIGSLVWILPVAALVVAVAGLGFAFHRWHRAPDHPLTDADRDLVETARRG